MVVGVGQQVAGLLRGGIWTDGVVDVLLLGEVRGLAAAVDTGRAGKDEVLDTKLVAELHQLRGALDVGVDVNEGVLDGRADAGPGGHVADPLGTLLLEDVEHELLVADVALVDGQALLVGAELAQMVEVGQLDLDVVVVVDLVDDHHVVSAAEEVLGNVRADEAGAAGHEDLLVSDVRGDLGTARRGRCTGRIIVGSRKIREAHGRLGPGDGRGLVGAGIVLFLVVEDRHTGGVLERHDGCLDGCVDVSKNK